MCVCVVVRVVMYVYDMFVRRAYVVVCACVQLCLRMCACGERSWACARVHAHLC